MADYQPSERRPIATRDYRISHRVANWLAGWGVSANAISGAGLVFGSAAGAVLAGTSHVESELVQRILWIVGAVLVQMRLGANMLDGMVATAQQTASPVGELYNEIPDRVTDSATLIGLGYAVGGIPTFGYLAAVAALFTAYIRAMGVVAGAQNEFCGPLAKPQRMFLVTVGALFCGLAPAAWQLQWSAVFPDARMAGLMLVIITCGAVATALRRVVRIAATLKGQA